METTMKPILGVYRQPHGHWVGDGFPVRSLFSYQRFGQQLSPFLLLDYAGPHAFAPTEHARGVGQHPHRGFETVTIVYDGEVAHQDSTGQGGVIGPGDVQWMTAGAGILHEEFHSPAFRARGGTLEMAQLWVNLPAKDKLTAPGYQAITAPQIPQVKLRQSDAADAGSADASSADAGVLRVIAGDYAGAHGPARTFSPMQVWDLRLRAGGATTLPLPQGWAVAVVVLRGTVQVNGSAIAREAELTVLGADGEHVHLEANNEATVLILSGAPLDEPIVGYGPFVMNSEQEIQQAIADVRAGRFGQLAS
jgi:hypothetical protein